MTGDGEDNAQSSEEVGNHIGKQRVQMIWTEETLKIIQNKTPKSTHMNKNFYRKGLWDKIQIPPGGFWEKDNTNGYLFKVLV